MENIVFFLIWMKLSSQNFSFFFFFVDITKIDKSQILERFEILSIISRYVRWNKEYELS